VDVALYEEAVPDAAVVHISPRLIIGFCKASCMQCPGMEDTNVVDV
jgi:hypothetical protein